MSMKFIRQLDHCWKGFQGQRSEVKVVTGPIIGVEARSLFICVNVQTPARNNIIHNISSFINTVHHPGLWRHRRHGNISLPANIVNRMTSTETDAQLKHKNKNACGEQWSRSVSVIDTSAPKSNLYLTLTPNWINLRLILTLTSPKPLDFGLRGVSYLMFRLPIPFHRIPHCLVSHSWLSLWVFSFQLSFCYTNEWCQLKSAQLPRTA